MEHSLGDLRLTEGQIFEQAILVVGLTNVRRRMGWPRKLADELVFVAVLGSGGEICLEVLQIEMGIEEGLVGNMPKFGFVTGAVPD